MTYQILPDSSIQLSVFDDIEKIEKQSALMSAVDKINGKYGRMNVRLASSGFGKRLHLRQERLSPCYTTRMSDLLRVKY